MCFLGWCGELNSRFEKAKCVLRGNDCLMFPKRAYLERVTTARNLLWIFLADLCLSSLVGFVVVILRIAWCVIVYCIAACNLQLLFSCVSADFLAHFVFIFCSSTNAVIKRVVRELWMRIAVTILGSSCRPHLKRLLRSEKMLAWCVGLSVYSSAENTNWIRLCYHEVL